MTPDDDIALFARGYYGRFRDDARWRAADQAARLGAVGDAAGEAVWRRIVVEVEMVAGGWRPTAGGSAASRIAANQGEPPLREPGRRRTAGRGR